MEPFTVLTGDAAPLLLDDVNTDQIAPVLGRHQLHEDYAKLFFARWRQRADGQEEPSFVLNRPQFRQARILVAGRNFGCGSSRESAVWAAVGAGIRCIVARSFADIFRENCLKNGLLPIVLSPDDSEVLEARVQQADGQADFTVDLVAQRIVCPDGTAIAFTLAPAERTALLEGLDEIGLTLKSLDAIAQWESRTRREQPWLQEARQYSGARRGRTN